MRLPDLLLHLNKRIITITACMLVMVLLVIDVDAQKVSITGNITDTLNSSLAGASVFEKGTYNGATTDALGNFQLSVKSNAVLVVSYAGYKPLEVSLNGQTKLSISLTPDVQQLNDVVVTGYGTQKRKEITGAVVSVTSKDFLKGNVSDPVQLLQGKVSGLQIGRVGGNPNQPFTIRLRGLNTISGNTSPLIVIDGVLGGALDALDPNDIESIDVLKDASAAAIYGVRASSGVIIVTTKSGKGTGRPEVNYSGQLSFEEISNLPKMATAEQYLKLGGTDLGSNTDWIKEVTQVGVSHTHGLSFSNRSGGFSYNASVNYRDVQSVIKNTTTFQQFNMRLNVSQRMWSNKLILSASIASTSRKENQGIPQAVNYALFFNPTAPIYDTAGNFFETHDQDRYNPVAINAQNERDRQLNSQLSNIKVDFEPIKNLVFSATYALQRESVLLGDYSARTAYFQGALVNGWGRRETDDETYNQFDGTVSYTGALKKLHYVVTAGLSYNYQNLQSQVAANSDFITDEFSYNNLAAGQGISKNGVATAEGNDAQPQNFVGSGQSESRSLAYFTRANLNYDDQFFLTGSYRREGSSRFGANNRWGNFWAISGGSDLAKVFNLKVDQLKLRAGYGVNGTLPNVFYGYLETLGLTSGGFANGQFISAITPATGSNPDLKWEEKGELDLGLDFGFFKKLSGSLDYFKRDTKDLLSVVDVPSPPSPVSQLLKNVGELSTKGFEFQLSYNAINHKDFSWTISGNFSTARTILVKINTQSGQAVLRGQGGDGAPIWDSIGKPIGEIYALKFVRYDSIGNPIVLDKDGHEVVYDNGKFRDNAVAVGNGLPKVYAGLTNTFRYRNFDLTLFLRGAFGHSLINEFRSTFETVSGISRNNVIYSDNVQNIKVRSGGTSNYVEKASYVKVDNLVIGYTIPIKKFRSVRIYASGQNLLTFTKYKGADPEVRYFDPPDNAEGRRTNSFTGDGLFPGIDNFLTFPPTRTYTFGLNIGL